MKALPERWPNIEFLWSEKYEPEKAPYLDTFHAVRVATTHSLP